MWSCPTCANPLELESKQWHCSNRHSFDVAKEGYVNLLLANQKHSTDPGDNRLMINARRAFLQQDYYLPLALHIAALLAKSVESNSVKPDKLRLHDAGCGEGYYLDRVVDSLAHQEIDVAGTGNDISKTAIAKASKK
jgi:23S rRNA (guanine745-N1)-methyltransferase